MTLPKSSTKADPEFDYREGFTTEPGLHVNERECPDAEARFAMELLRNHGVLMGTNDGEDSAGRAKIGYLSPAEAAARALDISQAFHAEARKRGCMIALPSADEIAAAIDAKREEREQAKAARVAAARAAQKEPASVA